MATDRERLLKEAAARGKYAPLYRHLLSLAPEQKWRAGFGELERVLGFRLPDSARLHRPWWANSRKGSGHSHALAWQAAGWRTQQVDLEAETLLFIREPEPAAGSKARDWNLDRDFPARNLGPWPAGFTVSREQIYDDMGRLTGGPEDSGDSDC